MTTLVQMNKTLPFAQGFCRSRFNVAALANSSLMISGGCCSQTCIPSRLKFGRTKSYEWRMTQLQNISRMLDEKEQSISEALHQDLSKPELEAFLAEISNTKSSCMLTIKELKNWMAPETVKTSVTTFPSSAKIVSEPLGVVLCCLLSQSLELLQLVKPSEIGSASSSLLANLFSEYLDNTTIPFIEGGVPETMVLLDQKWDKIFFTGGARVGRIVMTAAAPVVLEHGGKCPALVDSDVNL